MPGRPTRVARLPRADPAHRGDVRRRPATSTSTSPTACTGAPTSSAARPGAASAVLLRAGEVVAGEDLAAARRAGVARPRLGAGPGPARDHPGPAGRADRRSTPVRRRGRGRVRAPAAAPCPPRWSAPAPGWGCREQAVTPRHTRGGSGWTASPRSRCTDRHANRPTTSRARGHRHRAGWARAATARHVVRRRRSDRP